MRDLFRRLDRDPLLVLLTLPLWCSASLAAGTLRPLLALLAMFVVLSQALRGPGEGSGPRLLLLSAAAVATVLSHPPLFLLLCAVLLPLPLLPLPGERPGRRAALLAGALLPAGVLLATGVARLPRGPFRWERVIERVAFLPTRLLLGLPGSLDDGCLLLLAASWLLLCGTASASAKGPRDLLPELWFTLAMGAYLALPLRAGDGAGVSPPFLVAAAACGALLVRGPIAGWRRALLLPALAADLIYPALRVAQGLRGRP